MDESMKVYLPRNTSLVESHTELAETLYFRPQTRMETLRAVIEEEDRKMAEFEEAHPNFLKIYRGVMGFMIILVVISLIVWGIQVGINNKVESHAAAALADYDAKLQAEKEAAQLQAQQEAFVQLNSEENLMRENAKVQAKLLYGIRNFEEKYGYGESDLMTYLQCVDNRVQNGSYPNTVTDVVTQKDQWIGYFDSNPVIDKYYQIALKFEKAKRDREADPVSSDYVYAMTTERGIYLSDEFNSQHPYTWWRMA